MRTDRESKGLDEAEAEAGGRWLRLLKLATVDLGPLRRHRDFRLLFFGQLVSFLGSMITYVALPYQAFALTHSSLAVGLLGLAELVPLLGFAFLGGAFADSRDRRLIVLLTESAFALSSGLLAINALLPHPLIWPLYAIGGVRAALYGLQRPSLDALLPRLVSRDELVAASALSGLRGTTGMVVGPAAAGLLLAGAGLPVTYVVDVATFAFSLAMLWLMRAVPPPPEADKPSLAGVLDGLRYAAGRPELIGTYVVDFVAMVFGMPMALFPALSTRHGGPAVLGLMYSAPALGSLLATASSGWTARVHRHGLAVILAAAAWGLAIAAFGLVNPLWASLVLLALAGAADMVSGIFRMTIWNQTVPDALRGRLASLELLSYSSGPLLGNIEAGAVATLFDVRTSVVSGGVLCALGAACLALALPGFRRFDSRQRRAGLIDASTPQPLH